MTRLLIAIVFCIGAGSAIGLWMFRTPAYERNPVAEKTLVAPVLPHQGELKFDKEVVELGNVTGTTRFQFLYRNTSKETIREITIRSSCACQLSNPVGATLEPGQSGTLDVEIDAQRKPPGSHATAIDVTYRSTDPRTVRLLIHYTKEFDIIVPDEVLLYCPVEGKVTTTFVVTIYSLVEPKILECRSSSDRVAVTLQSKPSSYRPGWDFRFAAALDGRNLPPGGFNEALTIATDNSRHAQIVIPIRAYIRSRVRVAPDYIQLHRNDTDRPVARRVVIDDSQGESLEIDSIKTSSSDIKVEISRSEESRAMLTLSLKSGAILEGEQFVLVKIKRPSETELKIMVQP